MASSDAAGGRRGGRGRGWVGRGRSLTLAVVLVVGSIARPAGTLRTGGAAARCRTSVVGSLAHAGHSGPGRPVVVVRSSTLAGRSGAVLAPATGSGPLRPALHPVLDAVPDPVEPIMSTIDADQADDAHHHEHTRDDEGDRRPASS